MKFEERATLLTAESKDYNFDGNVGTSHRIRLNIGGEIYPIKSSAQQVKDLKDSVGEEGIAVVKVNSRKENISLELISFEVEK